MGGLFVAMFRQPFEPTDDLIWLNKLRDETFWSLPFSSAWTPYSNFYRPVAELLLKLLYRPFGFDPGPYRVPQFAVFVLLLWFCQQIVRRLGLRTESVLLVAVFLIGSPFTSGSIIWLAELPHVVVLVCFAAGLSTILSERSDTEKLALCGTAFAIALLSKENGLALLVFYLWFVRAMPLRATALFGSITLGYFAMRALVLGPGMGMSSSDEDVGYFNRFLTSEQKHQLFPGSAIFELYVYNVVAQIGAVLFRATKWGQIIDHINYEVVLQNITSAIIVVGIAAGGWRKYRGIVLLLAAMAIGGTLFSYSYARDRHLALSALAYGLLLAIAVGQLCDQKRLRSAAIAPLLTVWLVWSVQASLVIRGIHRQSIDLIEKVYRPNPSMINPNVPIDVWTAARESALRLR